MTEGTKNQLSYIEVGTALRTKHKFVAVSDQLYDTATKPISGVRMHIAMIPDDEVEFVIAALMQEIGSARSADIYNTVEFEQKDDG